MTNPDLLNSVIAALSLPGDATSDFDLNPNTLLPADRKLRSAGVLIPLLVVDGAVQVILTKRSSGLKHHPGQIAFPGGKQDDGDADITATALREADEEIGLLPDNVDVIGHLPTHETGTGFCITPVVGQVRHAFTPTPEPGEVAEVFHVPLAHLLDTTRYSIQSRRWRGQRRYYFTAPFGPYYVWGATACILHGLAQRVNAK